MRKKIKIISILSFVAISTLYALNRISYRPNKNLNGFTRTFSLNPTSKSFLIPETGKAICGVSGDSIFFTGIKPGIIYMLSIKTGKVEKIDLQLADSGKLGPVFFTNVNYPLFSILSSNSRVIVQGNLATKTYTVSKLPTGGFGNGMVISNKSFVVRGLATPTQNCVFKKITLNQDVIVDKDVSPRLNDGGFTYDGKLSFDITTSRLTFVSYYNNLLTCFDTNMNLLYRSHTIDTFGTPNIALKKTKNYITFSQPPVFVNLDNITSDGIIYVRSKLIADNEEKNFDAQSVVDKYDVQTGKYLGSFYIPIPSRGIINMYGLKKKIYILDENRIWIFNVSRTSTT